MRSNLARIAIAGALGSFSAAVPAVCVDGPLAVEREYRESVAVIVGRVLSETLTPEPPGKHDDGTTYRVKVVETLRGQVGATVDLLSENNSGRFPMEKGKSYLLFVSESDGARVVDNCGNSGLVVERRKLLGQLRKSRQ